MPTLQLKLGDYALDSLESWGEGIDWPVDAQPVPGSWVGVAFARTPSPRRITLNGFLGRNPETGEDINNNFRLDFDQLLRQFNDTMEAYKRTDASTAELWCFDDRYLQVKVISFTCQDEGGMSYCARFTVQVVAADPRWYSSTTSNNTWTKPVSSQFITFPTSQPGSSRSEPRFYVEGAFTSQLRLENRFKNLIKNAFLREGNTSTSQGLPAEWERQGVDGLAVVQHMYQPYADQYGRAYLRYVGLSGTTQEIFQDVEMTEPGSTWTLSSAVFVETGGGGGNFLVRLEALDEAKTILETYQCWPCTTLGEQSLVVTATAPSGTAYWRAAYVGWSMAGSRHCAFMRWMQLERGEMNSTPEYREHESILMEHVLGAEYSAWLDMQYPTFQYFETTATSNPVDLVPYITSGNVWTLDPGPNEILVKAGGVQDGATAITMSHEPAYWSR